MVQNATLQHAKKVLFLVSINPARYPFVDHQISLLRSKGVDTKIICRAYVDAPPSKDIIVDGFLSKKASFIRSTAAFFSKEIYHIANKQLYTLYEQVTESEKVGFRASFYRLAHWARIFKQVESFQPDLLHVHFAWHLKYAIPLSQYYDIPIICTAHGSDIYREAEWIKLLPNANIKHVITVADGLRQRILDKLPELKERITTVFNPINPDFLAPISHPPDKLQILNVAHFRKIKNQAWIIRALHRLRETGIDFECTFIGEGSEMQAVKKLAEDLGVISSTKFLGYQTHDEIKREMDKASVFVLPSESEGLPTVITEALARGRSVVGTDIRGIRDATQDGEYGFIVKLNDDKQLERAILQAHHSLTTCTQKILAGRQWVENEFSPDAHWTKLNAIYAQALDR